MAPGRRFTKNSSGGLPSGALRNWVSGRSGRKQFVYDVDSRGIVDTGGDESVVTNAERDIRIHPAHRWNRKGYRALIADCSVRERQTPGACHSRHGNN